MEANIIPSMKETLFDPMVAGMGDSLVDIADLGLDAVLADGVLDGVPVLKSIAALCRTGVNLRERNLIRQTATFISEFNKGTISQERLDEYRRNLEDDPVRAEKELGRIMLLLDRMLEEKQAKVLANFYGAYVKGAITWGTFVELSEVNARMLVSDYAELDSISRSPVQQTDEISSGRMCKIMRLVSLGLVIEHSARLHSGNLLTYEETDDRFTTTSLGGTFFSLMGRERTACNAFDRYP